MKERIILFGGCFAEPQVMYVTEGVQTVMLPLFDMTAEVFTRRTGTNLFYCL